MPFFAISDIFQHLANIEHIRIQKDIDKKYYYITYK